MPVAEAVISAGTKVRIARLPAELTGPHGAQLDGPATVTGTVTLVLADHPALPTTYEFKVRRDDTGSEIYCSTRHIVEVLTGDRSYDINVVS